MKFSVIFLFLLCALVTVRTDCREHLEDRDGSADFQITKWTVEEGLPQNTVSSIIQTSDGYIWLGTFGGLARFDGLKFTVFDSANTPALKVNRIVALYEDQQKRIWIGADSGEIYTLTGDVFEEFQPEHALERGFISGFAEDGDGRLYISSKRGIEKLFLDDEGKIISQMLVAPPAREISWLFKDSEQNIWVQSDNRFFLVKNDELLTAESQGIFLPRETQKIAFGDHGEVFAAGGKTLGTAEKGRGYREILSLDHENNSKFDFNIVCRDGSFWFQEQNHLYWWNESRAVRYDLSAFANSGARAVFFDRDNNLWLGTSRDGLIRVTRNSVGLVGHLLDSRILNTYSVIEDAKGAVWIGGLDLLKVQNGRATKFTRRDNTGAPLTNRSLAVDARDNLFIGTDDGVFQFRDGDFVPVPQFADQKIDALFFDKNQNLWGGGPQGLYRYKNGELKRFAIADGLAGDEVHFITQTKDERIWVGTTYGISVFADGKFRNFTTADGLSNNSVREIVEDETGTIWIGTYGGGINRFRDGVFQAITKREGLIDNFISRILADDFGKFWILTNHGIFAVERGELNAVADGTKKNLFGSSYGTSDGLTSSEASGGHQPAGFKTRDGKVWFPMIEDMAIIETKTPAGIAPTVAIERASSKIENDAKELYPKIFNRKKIEIENGSQNLEIEFTGLSFAQPEKLRFFYKLEGLDEDWTDAETRRTAFYPYLPSGEYTFLVKAVNVKGIWSENTARVSITVAKKFWQTWWFVLFSAVLMMAVVGMIFRLRLKNLAEKHRQQIEFSQRVINAHESERRRIANDLHDGLGQSLVVIKNRALLGVKRGGEPEQVIKELNIISESAVQALEEVREITNDLRPQLIDRLGLTKAISAMIKKVSAMINIESEINPVDNLFNEDEEIGIYRIVQESLNNIIKHSNASDASVRIKDDRNRIVIEIVDNGKGFETEIKGDYGGLGLTGLTERARFLDAELKIESKIGAGTRIELGIPVPRRKNDE